MRGKVVCINSTRLFTFKKGKEYIYTDEGSDKSIIECGKNGLGPNKGYIVYHNGLYIYFSINNFNKHFKSMKNIRKEKLEKINKLNGTIHML